MKLQHPTGMTVFRLFQYLLAVISAGLAAKGASWYGLYLGYYVTYWSAFWTVIFMIFRCFEHSATHNLFHILAIFLETLVSLSWLVSTITLAILNRSLANWESLWEQKINLQYHDTDLSKIFTDEGRASLKGSYAANAFAGTLFILFGMTWASYIHTYKKAKKAAALHEYPQSHGNNDAVTYETKGPVATAV